jgi:hypothetical protein
LVAFAGVAVSSIGGGFGGRRLHGVSSLEQGRAATAAGLSELAKTYLGAEHASRVTIVPVTKQI